MRKERNDLHLLRIVACLMVVLTHLTPTPMIALPAGTAPQLFYQILNAMSKFCVPLFLFLSATLLEINYSKALNIKEFYIKTLKRLIVPYLAWILIYYGVFLYRGVYAFSWNQLIKGILTGNIIYHLYYMVISIQLYLFYPLIRWAVSKLRPALFLVLSVFVTIWAMYRPPLPGYTHVLLPTYMLYIGMGIFVGANSLKQQEHRRFDWTPRLRSRVLEIGLSLYLVSALTFFFSYSSTFSIYPYAYILGSFLGILGIFFLCQVVRNVELSPNLIQASPLVERRDSRIDPPRKRGESTSNESADTDTETAGDIKSGKSALTFRLKKISGATDLVYFAHPLVMMVVQRFIQPERYFVIFCTQLGAILVLWAFTIAWRTVKYKLFPRT